MSKLTPTLHKEIPMNTRVVVPAGFIYDKNLNGTVIGIAMQHVIFTYIVLLDSPIDSEYGPQSAIVVPGTYLTTRDGIDWKL